MQEEIINGRAFNGPWSLDVAKFNPIPGIYIIVDTNNSVVDVGQTNNLQQRMANHERENCWGSNNGTRLWFTRIDSEMMRLIVEQQIRETYKPVCGVR